jgi:hypothetical protein
MMSGFADTIVSATSSICDNVSQRKMQPKSSVMINILPSPLASAKHCTENKSNIPHIKVVFTFAIL